MKRIVSILIVFALTLTALMSSCASEPPAVECDFGYTDTVYMLGNSLERAIEPESDVELGEFFEEMQLREYDFWQEMFRLYLKPVEGRNLCFRDVDYDKVGNSGGIIEKRIGDKWQYFSESGDAIGDYSDNGGWSTHPLRVDRMQTPNMRAYAPIYADPGDYRITMYFRECDESGQPKDDAVHHLSFDVSVPERSDKPFDVIQAELENDDIFPKVTVHIRKNSETEGMPAVDTESFKLAYEDGGKLVNVPPRDGKTTVASCPDSGWVYPFADYTFSLYYPTGEFDTSKTYRLTVTLKENVGSSFEQYDLTLRLCFDK